MKSISLFLFTSIVSILASADLISLNDVGLIGQKVNGTSHSVTIPSPPNVDSGCTPCSKSHCAKDEHKLWSEIPCTWNPAQDTKSNLFSCPSDKIVFCCRVNFGDKTWAGKWQSSMDGMIYYCSFGLLGTHHHCGALSCSTLKMEEEEMEIKGPKCNQLWFGGLEGRAMPGVIRWSNGTANTHYWFKL